MDEIFKNPNKFLAGQQIPDIWENLLAIEIQHINEAVMSDSNLKNLSKIKIY